MGRKKYTGIGMIGNETISSIYTVDNGIVDINGTGIYHLFYKEYHHDLLQTAASMIKIKDTIYYGNRKWKEYTHPAHLKPLASRVEDHYRYVDEFQLTEHQINKKDTVYAYGKNKLVFEVELSNYGESSREISCYAYAAIRNGQQISSKLTTGHNIMVHTGKVYIGMVSAAPGEHYMIEDSPTDFAYQTFLDIMEKKKQTKPVSTNCRLGCAQGAKIRIPAGKKRTFRWALIFADSPEELEEDIAAYRKENAAKASAKYWSDWLKEGNKTSEKSPAEKKAFHESALTNLIAIKAVCLGGYIAADLTGHYFYNKAPCYYARDSIMAARAFLLSGHYRECEEIIKYLLKRQRKPNGEFYQRYDGFGAPNEGANNNVFHQIDSIGYFCKIVYDFYKKTGKMLITERELEKLVDVIDQAESKYGMAGAEGGVNEGVFGEAFITSSNMFIYGGLTAAAELFAIAGNSEYISKTNRIRKTIYEGIQTTFNERWGRFDYGYVKYHDHPVRKYDTPQYFGPLYGYPNDEKMQQTHQYLLRHAAFFKDGIGYSEQEYHHGPWLFNTLACAEYCKITGDMKEYRKKMKWAKAHSNAYGLLPEAVDANDESQCFINPLTWACAEFVASYYRQGEIR